MARKVKVRAWGLLRSQVRIQIPTGFSHSVNACRAFGRGQLSGFYRERQAQLGRHAGPDNVNASWPEWGGGA